MTWSRDALEKRRKAIATSISDDRQLHHTAIEFLKASYEKDYCYQWDWLGLPLLQMPEDVVALQEVIWKTRPNVILETGVAWGGSIALSSSLLSVVVGGGKVIGVDLNLDPELQGKLDSLNLATEIHLLQGDSTSPEILDSIKSLLSKSDRVMVILDSNHTHEHVLQELRSYSQLVTPGQFLLVGDTSIRDLADSTERVRPWSRERNPATAVEEFLVEEPTFAVSSRVTSKLLTSFHPGGYLERTLDNPRAGTET